MARQWTIRPVCYGEYPEFEKSALTYNRNAGQKIRVPFLGWLLQSGDESILVDTGPGDLEWAAEWHAPMRRTPDQFPDAALRALGVDAARLKLVVLSHLHWDHCYGLECFPAARFVVQAEELRSAVDPLPTQRVPYEVGMPGVRPPWMAVFDRLQVVRGDLELVPGIQLLLLPGHTAGIQGVLVETAAGRHLIASDAVPLYENMGAGGGEIIPAGIHTDVSQWLRSFDRMRSLADVILPSHDVEVLKQAVYPAS